MCNNKRMLSVKMKQNMLVHIFVSFFTSASYWPLALSRTTDFKYLKFSNQCEPLVNEATNIATLKNGGSVKLSVVRLIICGSIYIGFYRRYQAFYTLSSNG